MLLTPEACAELRRKHYNTTIASLKWINSDLMVVRVRPDFQVPTHQPGQYGTLGLGYWEPRVPDSQEEEIKPSDRERLVRRAYSLSCSVLDDDGALLELSRKDWIEFYIVLVREAEKRPPALTPRLFLLKEGDRLFLGEKITGHYNLEGVQPTDSVVFLSTGTGEAPHNYMLWELLRRGHSGRILAACCVRYRRDLGYYDLHQELTRRSSNYTYLSLTTREAANVGHKVYIQDLITSGQLEEKLGAPLDPAHTHVYLCGNPNMIGVPIPDRATGQVNYPQPPGVIEFLSRRGFKMDQPAVKFRGNIHLEEYW
jgi:ferredoxin--NADP+ reductase